MHRGRRGDTRKGFTEAHYARLLDDAHQQFGGPLVVVWGNLNAHVSRAMGKLVDARDWLTVFQLPPYAHELNPVEPVWSHLKWSLANRTLAELTALVKTRLKKMQCRPGLLDGFLASTSLDLAPFCNPQLRNVADHTLCITALSQTQVIDAGSVERCGGDEKQQPENNGEDVRKHDISLPETMPHSPIDLLWLPPPRFIGAVVAGIL